MKKGGPEAAFSSLQRFERSARRPATATVAGAEAPILARLAEGLAAEAGARVLAMAAVTAEATAIATEAAAALAGTGGLAAEALAGRTLLEARLGFEAGDGLGIEALLAVMLDVADLAAVAGLGEGDRQAGAAPPARGGGAGGGGPR